MGLLITKGEQLGGVLGSNIGAAKIPAAHDVECDLQTKPVGFFECVYIELAPCRRAELRPGGHRLVAILCCSVRVDEKSAA